MYPISHINNFGKSDCAYWEGFLTPEDINYLYNTTNSIDMMPALIGSGNNGIVDNKIRSTKIAWLDQSEKNKHIWEKLANVVAEVNSKFFHFDLVGFNEQGQLGVYTVENSDHYDWHIDMAITGNSPVRKLSMVLMLSDPSEFEGGDLLIKTNTDKPIKLDLAKGRAWFFPSWVLHKVTPVTKGTRKSLVLWVNGPQFK